MIERRPGYRKESSVRYRCSGRDMQLIEKDQTKYYIVDVDSLSSSWLFFLSTHEDCG